MRKTLTTAALTAVAMVSAAGSAAASTSPLPAGPMAFKKITGMLVPDNNTGSNVSSGSPLLNLEKTNAVNLMSDHSQHQTAGTSGNQG